MVCIAAGAPLVGSASIVARPSARAAALAALLAALFLAAEVALVVVRLGGHFAFTLDDPYIHLALADEIAGGRYGLVAGPAAPSSSILFPFLLVALRPLGLGQFAPLLLNAVATAGGAAVFAVLAFEALPGLAAAGVPALVFGCCAAMLGFDATGLALTGLEHSLHVAVTAAWLLGALRFLRRGEVAPWWWACSLVEPLIRYEGLSLWLAGVALLALRGRARPAAALALAGAAALGGFSLFLLARGLPALPSSVLAKSGLVGAPADAGLAAKLAGTVAFNLTRLNALALVAMAAALAAKVVRPSPADDAAARLLAGVAVAASAAHLAFGSLDGYLRYEIYVLVLDGGTLLIAYAPELASVARMGRFGWIAVPVALIVLSPMNVLLALRGDLGARNIYEQQMQMARFATDFYRAPVAVNDLGAVSYGNPHPVLDLAGLGSEEARRARRDDPSHRWMQVLADRADAGLAMVYTSAFRPVPAGWALVARLRLASPRTSAAGDVVDFYATGPDRRPKIEAALDLWAPTLPDGVRLDRPARDASGQRVSRLDAPPLSRP